MKAGHEAQRNISTLPELSECTIIINDMQTKQRVHLKLCNQKEFGKHSYTDSLSPKIKPPYNNLQILHESSVARFPANKFARAQADY